ncbi:MAG: hypothetical protein OEY74_00420 [Gammaproteobacteria bacterium]|nr:hypothetical protein [Gammaproteobacteria bacterium]
MKLTLSGILAPCLLVVYFASGPGIAAEPVRWSTIRENLVAEINSDIETGKPTVDVGIYFPSNHDPAFKETYSLDTLLKDFVGAKEIFSAADMQLNLLWIKTGDIDPQYLEIQANTLEGTTPSGLYTNMYVDSRRQDSGLTQETRDAFESIIEMDENNRRTVYIVTLQSVFMSFYEKLDERTWAPRTITTGGLSFPGYSYPDIPDRWRGVITVNKTYDVRSVVAHELGHKLMNVSHEYRDVDPQHEVRAEGGLMLYGAGTDIPSGEEGRWHRERLHLSPYVYVESSDGERTWNADYKEDGHYYDPLYGDYVVEFGVAAPAE